MTLIGTLKSMRVALRKDPLMAVEFGLLTLIVGEVETITKRGDKELSDAQVLAIINKLEKSVTESLAVSKTDKLLTEKFFLVNLLAAYTPKQLTGVEIIEAVKGANNLGEAMKLLKANYAGQYEGKLASTVVNAYFTSEV